MVNRELHTADDVPLFEIAEKTENLIELFNDAERPFRDLFSEQVGQQTFLQEVDAEADTFEALSEGEFPSTYRDKDDDYYQMTIRTEEYGQALGFSQRFIERSTSDRILRQVQAVIDNAKETEEQAIHDVIFNGIADGTEDVWFDVPSYGNNDFTRSHDHEFADTAELFGDTSAHAPHSHIEVAADDLRHHGWDGQKVCLCSSSFKRNLRDEISWDASYHIPQATGMRSTNLNDLTINIDGVQLLQSPYLTGDEFYIVDVGEYPVKHYEDRPLQVTQPTGGPAVEPGELLNATATMVFGVSMVNPLGAVHFAGDSTNYS